MSRTIWIARHANRLDFVNPEWFNTAERPYDPPLSDDGVIQATQLAQRLKSEKIVHIFSSPFLRALQTANQVAEALDLPIKIESGLSEWLNPDWMPKMPETLPPSVLKAEYPRIDLSYRSCVIPEYPENQKLLRQRTAKTVLKLKEIYKEDFLLVGHGGSVLGTTIALVGENQKINASLCCLIKIVELDGHWHLQLNGDTTHLTQTESTIRMIM